MQDNRRDILKKIGIGTAWTTPVVQSIILPAHAQCSTCPSTEPPLPTSAPPTLTINTISFNTGCVDNNSVVDKVNFGEATLKNESGTDIEVNSVSMTINGEPSSSIIINGNASLPLTVLNNETFVVNGVVPLADQQATCGSEKVTASLTLNTNLGTFNTSA